MGEPRAREARNLRGDPREIKPRECGLHIWPASISVSPTEHYDFFEFVANIEKTQIPGFS